jgi:two-component system chemotaxis response regulator CheY
MKRRITALIIDDSETNRYLLNRQLKMLGVRHVFEQNDGSTAIAFLEDKVTNSELFGNDFPPTVIFLDLNMPTMDGFTFLDAYSNANSRLSKLGCAIFVYSSSDRADNFERAMSHKCVSDFLVKGETSLAQLQAAIQNIH